ncbi:MAG: hypothetical protein GW858_08525 [Sphingomonadales bacterium]|nr:hypothetical protein [Sphingomonadales bacterium]NCQ21072.1 hypothetical protein [Sphingomonadales bacterium]NCT03861.1 hypothetical protein [Sphingomonadales bacterium]
MILTLDNSAFTYLVNPNAKPPNDPSTGTPVAHAKERIEGLISSLGKQSRLILPTPALAEALVGAGLGAVELIEKLNQQSKILVVPFDQKCAVELAMMHMEVIEKSGSKRGGSTEPWQKVKFDRQIVAIAKVHNSTRIFSDDIGLCSFAKTVGLEAVSTWELPVPEKDLDLFG